MKKLTVVVALFTLVVSTGMLSGCHPRMAAHLAGAAIITAAVVGSAVYMAHHDAHFHDHHCGHRRHWHEGRWVYYYNDHWEYHDGGRWYYYDE